MRRSDPRTLPPPEDQRSDLLLWSAILLAPLAAGINTIVGFTVAHWTTDTNQKHFSYLVSAVDVALCLCGYLIGSSLQRRYREADELLPENGRRLFMARIGIWFSALAFLLVIGGTLAVLILNPAD